MCGGAACTAMSRVQFTGGKSMSVSLMRLNAFVKMMSATARLISTSC
jgi:hypothetical protein